MDTLFPIQPIATHDRKGRRVRAMPYAVTRGAGPAGYTCATCAYLLVNEMYSGKRFFKCGKSPVTGGPGTDIRKKDPACSKYEHGPGRQIYPAHTVQPPARRSIGTIKEYI